MFYDLKNHRQTHNLPIGTFGQISFERLAEQLRNSGEIKPNEEITHFDIGSNIIRYRTETKE
jgi:hypothetical protein